MLNRQFVYGSLACLAALTAAAHAAVIPLVSATGSLNPRTGYSGSLGYQFTVGAAPLTVTELGLYDYGNGFQDAHLITLYLDTTSGLANTTGAAVESTTVGPTSGPTTPGFVYANLLTPIVLSPGVTYTLAADYPDAGGHTTHDPFSDGQPGAFTSALDVGSFDARYSSTASGGFPDTAVPNNLDGYVGPNLLTTTEVVPEPASLGLLALGGLLLLRKRA